MGQLSAAGALLSGRRLAETTVLRRIKARESDHSGWEKGEQEWGRREYSGD